MSDISSRPSDEQLLAYGQIKELKSTDYEFGNYLLGYNYPPTNLTDGNMNNYIDIGDKSTSQYLDFSIKKPCYIWVYIDVKRNWSTSFDNLIITNKNTNEIIDTSNSVNFMSKGTGWHLLCAISEPGEYKWTNQARYDCSINEWYLQALSNVVIPDVENPEKAINEQGLLTALAVTKNYIDLNTSNIVANNYSEVVQYHVDDYVTFGTKLYKCKVQCLGIEPPNTTYWEETSVGDELNNGGGNADAVILTKSEYDALPNDKLTDNKQYFVTDWSQEGTSINVIDDLTSDSSTDALSAKQGKLLNDTKQDKNTPIQITNDSLESRLYMSSKVIDLWDEKNGNVASIRPDKIYLGKKYGDMIAVTAQIIYDSSNGQASSLLRVSDVLAETIKDYDGNTLSDIYNKMDKENPTGTGSFSLNRKADTTVGDYSHAEGLDTTASGNYSHAEGRNTIASAYYSHAEGYGTTASEDSQHVQGKFNIADTTSAFIIGNGTNTNNRSNALKLDWNGNLNIAGTLTGGVSSIAPQYNAETTYAENDYCYYNGKLYKCILQCTGTTPLNTTYWEKVTVMTAINNAILGAIGGSY